MPSKLHIEQEIKLTAANASTLTAVLHSSMLQSCLRNKGKVQAQQLHAFYYDTTDWQLRKKGWSLRTRQEDAVLVAALKRNSTLVDGLSCCEELEQVIPRRFSRVGEIPKGLIYSAMQEYLSEETALIAQVEVKMLRRKTVLHIGGAQVEFAADAGTIQANGSQKALFEIELELRSGSLQDQAVTEFVKQLTTKHDLRPSSQSKHQVGLSLFQNLL